MLHLWFAHLLQLTQQSREEAEIIGDICQIGVEEITACSLVRFLFILVVAIG